MRSATILAIGSVVSAAAAVSKVGFEFPADVPLNKRQTEGPRYECHANCGFALRGSGEDGFCDDSEWVELLEGCLDCALEFNIWKHYGDGLEKAAEECGLDATPVPADGDDEGDNEDDGTTSTVAAPTSKVTSTWIETSIETSTQEPEHTEERGHPEKPEETTYHHTPSTNATHPAPTHTPSPSEVPESGASQTIGSMIFVAGAAVAVAVNLM